MATTSLHHAAGVACPWQQSPAPACAHRCAGTGGAWGWRPRRRWLCPGSRWWTRCTRSGRPARAASTAPPPPPAGGRAAPPWAASGGPALRPLRPGGQQLLQLFPRPCQPPTRPGLGWGWGAALPTPGLTRLQLQQDQDAGSLEGPPGGLQGGACEATVAGSPPSHGAETGQTSAKGSPGLVW